MFACTEKSAGQVSPSGSAASPAAALPPELAELDVRFQQLLQERVTSVFAAGLAELDSRYLGALAAKIADAQAAGNLDGALALNAEKKRVEDKQPMPETDEKETPASVGNLRAVYRAEHAKLATARAENFKALASPLEARLAQMESDLTRGGRLDDAKTVRSYREALGEEVADLATLGESAPEPVSPGGTGVGNGMEGAQAGETRAFGGIEMAWCPPGSFMMGSPAKEEGRQGNEDQSRVRLRRGFWMGRTEVTQEQWETVMGSNPGQIRGENLPVETVSWEDAQEFLAKLNESAPLAEGWRWALPTEAQWEYACRAGTERAFHFGAVLDGTQANVNGTKPYGTNVPGPYVAKTAAVGSYEPNAWGLHDMHGNVREWCADWYGDKPPGGSDPVGPSAGTQRVVRGGNWGFEAQACRAASRSGGALDFRGNGVGLRLAVVPARR